MNVADRYSGTANARPSAARPARRDRAPVLPARVRTTDVAASATLPHWPPGWGLRPADPTAA
jgi:hypothetical protein